MAARIPKSVAVSLGFDLREAVAAFRREVAAHARTVGVPAPTAHPLVEGIVRNHGGDFDIVDDTIPTPAQLRVALAQELEAEEARLTGAIISPARRSLAAIELADLHARPDLTAGEARAAQAMEDLFTQVRAIQRRKAELSVALETLPDNRLATWSPSWDT